MDNPFNLNPIKVPALKIGQDRFNNIQGSSFVPPPLASKPISSLLGRVASDISVAADTTKGLYVLAGFQSKKEDKVGGPK